MRTKDTIKILLALTPTVRALEQASITLVNGVQAPQRVTVTSSNSTSAAAVSHTPTTPGNTSLTLNLTSSTGAITAAASAEFNATATSLLPSTLSTVTKAPAGTQTVDAKLQELLEVQKEPKRLSEWECANNWDLCKGPCWIASWFTLGISCVGCLARYKCGSLG